MPYIYKITNQINGKLYIGKTLESIEHRWKQHISDSKKENIKNRPLYSAFNKYGIENFTIEPIEECEVKDIDERERYWIEYFNSFENGYNATLGGDGRQYINYDLVYSYWIQGLNEKQIQEKMNIDVKTIRKILHIYLISKKDINSRGRIVVQKKVKQIIDTDNFIIHNSITDAYNYINKSYSSHIQEVCNGKRKSAYGYKWEWINNDF